MAAPYAGVQTERKIQRRIVTEGKVSQKINDTLENTKEVAAFPTACYIKRVFYNMKQLTKDFKQPKDSNV